MLNNPTKILPINWTFENFKTVLFDLNFTINIRNSLIIALSTTLIAIVISSLAAYGIVRFFPKLGDMMTKVLVTTYMFPSIMLVIPYAMVMSVLNLTNTRIGLVLVYLSFSVPYAVWMLVGFFKTVPIGIEEAAKIDGAGVFRTFTTVTFPLLKPVVATVAILNTLNVWNDFMGPLYFLQTREKDVILQEVYRNIGQFSTDWTSLFPMMVLGVLPLLVFYLFMQRYIISGVMAGSVKG